MFQRDRGYSKRQWKRGLSLVYISYRHIPTIHSTDKGYRILFQGARGNESTDRMRVDFMSGSLKHKLVAGASMMALYQSFILFEPCSNSSTSSSTSIQPNI